MTQTLCALSQVVSNLLNNAAKYTPEGGKIDVTVRREAGHAVITVSDNGVGIPADMLPKVFQLFTQVDRTLDRAQGGLGIGLALLRQLVDLHGGTIVAESDGVDRGSRFIVHVPAAAPAATVVPVKPIAEPPTANAPAADEPPLRVLVVDDNIEVASTIGWMLETIGHEYELAYDGPQASSLAKLYNPT